VPDVRGYSELLMGLAVPFAGFRAIGLDVFQALDATLIALTFGTYLAAYAMLRRGIRTSVGAATLGAAFYAFGYPRFASRGHMQLQFTVLQPLILWAVIASVRGAASRPRLEIAALLVAVSVMWVLVFATVYYFGWLLALFALT